MMHPICSTARKGLILAGGSGTRLHPLTRTVSKQLMPVYDKPMIYYPLAVLMLGGVREILIITTPDQQDAFRGLLGDGRQWGLHLDYTVQPSPDGLAQALILGEEFLDGAPSALILGDNLFYGHGFPELLREADGQRDGATIFSTIVADPTQYGVVTFAADGRAIAIEEKPTQPRSHHAVTGLYFYDASAPAYARALAPSARGELEITDLNRIYLDHGTLSVTRMGRGFAWLDTGTHSALLDAANYVRLIEERQGLKICCPEEIAWRQGFINSQQLRALALPLEKSGYGRYLLRLLDEELA